MKTNSKKEMQCICLSCKNLVKDKGKLRYTCTFAPGITRLGQFDLEPLKMNCGGFERKNNKE